MVKFKSNRSLPYTRIDGLDNCEIDLCLSSDEESQKDVNNEESGDKSSHFIDPENYIFLVCLSVAVFDFGILYVLKHNYSTDIHKVIYVFYSGLFIVGTIMIVILFTAIVIDCTLIEYYERNRKRLALEKALSEQNQITHIFDV